MKKLVIQTQYLENYGTQEQPYMKFKGGNTYELPNCGTLNSNEVATIVSQVKPHITCDLHTTNGGCEEYITGVTVEDKSAHSCEDWETVTEFYISNESSISFMKVTDNREDGYMRSEILEKVETWVGDLSTESGRSEYKAEFLMDDGDLVIGDIALRAWFESNKKVA